MDNQNYSWKQTTADLYKAVMIYTFAAIAASIFGFIGTIGSAASAVASFAGGNLSGGGFGIWDILEILATVAVIYGYWLFIKSLDIFKQLVNPADAPRIGSIRTATILSIVGAIVACIPVIGFVGGILNLIAWILLLIAYANLKNSVTFPEGARRGMSKLFTAMILGIIGWVIGLIPLVGGIIETILEIVAFVNVLLGWKNVSMSEEPTAQA